MILIIAINIIVVFLAYLSKYKNLRWLFKFSFFIIFFYSAFRYGFGRDYMSYLDIFNRVNNYDSISSINFDKFRVESGWIILNFLFKDIGFFGFIIFLYAIFTYTYYDLIKKYVEPKLYWFAIFIYTFTFNIMWIQLSAMRQALAVAIFIFAIRFLLYKFDKIERYFFYKFSYNNILKPIIYIALILFANTFHSSVLAMLIMVVFSFEIVKNNKIIPVLMLIIFIGLLVWQNSIGFLIQNNADAIFDDTYSGYLNSDEGNGDITIIGTFSRLLLLFIVLFYSRSVKGNFKLFYYLTALSYFIYIISPFVLMSGRMIFYFSPFAIIVYPNIIKNVKNIYLKYSILMIFILYTLNQLKTSVSVKWIIEGYTNYSTIYNQ